MTDESNQFADDATVEFAAGADDVLAEMRRRKAREALVIDEYGGTAGLVTLESLMERIIGEIPGEKGAHSRTRARADGSSEIDGLALVADVQNYVIDQGYTIPIFEEPQAFAASPRLKGFAFEAVGRPSFYAVWLAPK